MSRAKRRRSMAKKLVASTALVGGALALEFGGAFAQFTDTATAGPQTISSGTIEVGVGPTNDTATAAADIVPGDTVAREVDINSTTATANAASITLQVKATVTSLLDTDGTNGLQLSIQACSQAWTRHAGPPLTYTCGGAGGATTVDIGGNASTSVAALEAAAAALTPLKSLTAKGQDYLVFTLTLPAGAPGNLSQMAACSGAKGGTAATENLEGCSSTLTYSLVATQRAGTNE